MPTTVRKRWLKDKAGGRIAPKTLLSQVLTNEGVSAEKYIEDVAHIDIEDNENIETENPDNSSITIDAVLSEDSTNPVQNKVITKEVKEKLSLPKTDGAVNYGVSGQFAVSDGNGGLDWVTIPLAKGESF